MTTTKEPKFILSKGNMKLSNGTFIYSHTPVKGCYDCSSCAKTCFAKPRYNQYPSVKNKWDYNYNLSKTNEFYNKFCNEIKQRKIKLVRLFQSGDAYNNEIIDKLYNIIKDSKDTFFYGYTKNKNALKLNELPNCNMIYSFIEGYRNYGSREYVELLRDKFGCEICELDESKGEKCMKDCTKCKTCKSVAFVQHGMYKNDLSYEQSVIEELKGV